MKHVVRRGSLKRQPSLLIVLFTLLVLISVTFPAKLEATGSRLSVVQAVSQELSPLFTFEEVQASGSLDDFTKRNITKLAEQAPFKDWSEAKPEYYPLGPGTHGWLVNVMKGQQRIGYMIVSAAEDGGYLLSEYGAGTYGLPYSLSELHRLLVQQGLISSASSGPIKLTALYAPLLPVWKLSIEGKTVFIDAAAQQVLPWTLSQADNLFKSVKAAQGLVGSGSEDPVPHSVYRTGGTDDPYRDLLWLTAPELGITDGGTFASLLSSGDSVAFQSVGRNAAFGAPFMITGYQSWQTSGKDTADTLTLYAASGPGGKRYLPLSVMLANGTLHKLPRSGHPSFH